MAYQVSREQLDRYADVVVNFALGGGNGIKPGEVVEVTGPESSKPLYAAVCREVWRAGGHVLGNYLVDEDPEVNLTRDFYEIASPEQHGFFPAAYYRGAVDEADHSVYILCEADPFALKGVEPVKILTHQRAYKPLFEWRMEKESAGKMTWTIVLYPTAAMAREADMSVDEYWAEVVKACFLDHSDPKERWREVYGQQQRFIDGLNALPIDRLHVKGPDADLWVTLGESRRWMGGEGRNIPSFEIFTSPDWRGTEGWIRFSEPLYQYGTLISGIELSFQGGEVKEAKAKENEPLLHEMLATENADKVGEYSLTDSRLSPITRFMANTLFDENVGGPYGNTHLAVGKAFPTCYDGDPDTLSAEDLERMGFNDSAVHTDIVSTTDREVTAVLTDGSERTIYAAGQFQLD